MVIKLKRILGICSYKKILRSDKLKSLKSLIMTFINIFKTNGYNFNDFLEIKSNKFLMSIIIDIYYLYEEELKSTKSVDFNDMIIIATKGINEKTITNYKYIIVDEYQDTSYIRYKLLNKLIETTKAKIMCVGDDFQSIYRFTGCDLGMFLNFKKYFKKSKILTIPYTYRNSQELIDVAGNFIMKNKDQMYKKLKSHKRLGKPIKISYDNDIFKILDIIVKKHNNILILGRNNNDIKKYIDTGSNVFKYKGATVKYLTIHSSKGLEADSVIIINLEDNILGFPSKMEDSNLLKSLSKYNCNFPYDEERRLFYVALTRTKNEVYLIVNKKNISVFITELVKNYSKYIEYI